MAGGILQALLTEAYSEERAPGEGVGGAWERRMGETAALHHETLSRCKATLCWDAMPAECPAAACNHAASSCQGTSPVDRPAAVQNSTAGTSYQQSVLQPSQAALMLGLAAAKLSQVTVSATVLFRAAVSGEQSATVPSCTGPAAALVSPALSTPMQSTELLMAELNMPLVSMDMVRPPSPRAGWLGSQITPTIQPLLGTATPHCDLWADPGHMSSWMPRCQTNIIPGGSTGTEDPQVAAP